MSVEKKRGRRAFLGLASVGLLGLSVGCLGPGEEEEDDGSTDDDPNEEEGGKEGGEGGGEEEGEEGALGRPEA